MADPIENAPASAPAPVEDAARLREELLRERFEAVATKHGLDEQAIDLVAPAAHKWLTDNGREATRESLAEYMGELKKLKPRLFAAPAAAAPAAPSGSRNTAPAVPHAPAAHPAPSALETPYAKWRALKAAGRVADAEAYYRMHRHSISRSA